MDIFLPTPASLEKLKAIDSPVIVEIAGRDSVAAMIAYAADHPSPTFIPTIVSTGTEYGDAGAPLDAIEYAKTKIPSATFTEPIQLFSPNLWRALNGRYGSELSRRYPGWSPCASCHLYVHLMRSPLAFALGVPILTGERDSHDDRFKLSQTPQMINAWITLFAEKGIELLEPIQHLTDSAEIERLVGRGWEEGARQLQCVHSGSFTDVDGHFNYRASQWDIYLRNFAIPAARAVLDAMRAGELTTDWVALVGAVLRA